MIYLWGLITVACGMLATINFMGIWGIWFLACILGGIMTYAKFLKGY